MHSKLPFLCISLILSLTGCVTRPGYESFYTPLTNLTFSAVNYSDVVVQLYRTDEELLFAYGQKLREGAIGLGSAGWDGPYTDPDKAKWRAVMVDANLVLVSISPSGTQTGVLPLPVYNPGSTTTYTTHNSGSISTYGGARGSYSGQSTTYATTPGSTTYSYVPYSVQRYHHWAVFLRHDKESANLISQANCLPISKEDDAEILRLRMITAASSTNTTNDFVHAEIGDIYMRYLHYLEAIDQYQHGLRINPRNAYIMSQLGSAFYQQRMYDDAILQYNALLEIAPDNVFTHIDLAACCYFGKRDYINAEMHWKTALKLLQTPNIIPQVRINNPERFFKGKCYWGLALICYDKKNLSEGSDNAYQAGRVFVDCKEKPNALKMVDLIKTNDPTSPLSAKLTDCIYKNE